ncbi:two-component regulator propeller domain-containing protein [Spirosoma sp.]|uniref:sensor histidine kinase n=1 Tax=Spirosoma sp. TaxID=1899569 RepID=UPI0026239A2C|nr:two-component regulator propeller domain-containing protein [Spirosoma sp.]MCX6213486.1 ATP-binding protein [Spirosoma sp.]
MKATLTAAVIWLCISSLNVFRLQAQGLTFSHLTTNQGLSQSHVCAILKDKKGFMWFGTEDGLNKYDGYTFTHYKEELDNKSSICNSYVLAMLEDKAGNLWIGTSGGLDRFDGVKNKFVHHPDGTLSYSINDIFQDSKDRLWLGTDQGLFLFNSQTGTYKPHQQINRELRKYTTYVSRVLEDNNGNLWVGTEKGLYRYTAATNQIVRYSKKASSTTSIQSDWIKELYKDGTGAIWIGTDGGGLSVYDQKSNSFRSFLHNPLNSRSITHNDILSVMEDRSGNLWIGTENGGISIYDKRTDLFTTYQNNPDDNGTLNNNSVYCIYRDNADNIWIGTYAGGVNFVPRFGRKFDSYRQIANDPRSLSNNVVLAICGDPSGNENYIWIGTDGGGLNLFDRKTKRFTQYRHSYKDRNSISNNHVISVIRVAPDVLGLGFHNGGFDFFNVKTGISKHHLPKANDSRSLSISDVNNLFKDRDGNIWVGTWKGGLNFYNVKDGTFTHYRTNPDDKTSISDNIVTAVFQDTNGDIWVGTYKGLNRLDRARKRFTRYQHDPQNKHSLSNDNVQSILGADHGNLWIGTVGGGVNYFDTSKQTFKAYTEKEGLASNIVFAIQKDRKNILWLSTNNGLSRFDPRTKTFQNFGHSDGLQGNEFRDNSSFQTTDGQLFFGGVNGFSTFHPDSLKKNTFIPPVYITDFLVFNKPVSVGDKHELIHSHISETDLITLSYKESVFTFEFAALNYTVPEKNQYAYKLEGFDAAWNYIGTKRTATYTNLDPGTYTFRVKASNNDGLWNSKGTSLTVVIMPPFWLTWWFKTLMTLFLLGTLYGVYRLRVNRIKAQQVYLQKEVQARTSEVLQQKQELQDQALHMQLLQPKVEQQAAQQQLQESEQRFQEIAENVDEVFWIHSAKPFRLLYVNTAFERVWNTTLEQLKERPLSFMETVLAEDVPAVRAFMEQYKAGIDGELYCRLQTNDAPLRWLLIRSFTIRDEAGNALRHIGIASDVTVQKEKEFVLQKSLLREQELNQLKSQFVSTASHEFRTPMTTIQSSVELIKLYLDAPAATARASIQKHLGVIEKQIAQFSSLLTDVLTIGQIEAGKITYAPRAEDVVGLCETLIDTHFSERADHRSVRLLIEGTPRWVNLDAKLMTHVLMNLLSNAFKFSVTTSPILRVIFSPDNLILQVIDAGIGIPVKEQTSLFQAFFRGSNTNGIQGTGLGLVIARQFVECHGGTLDVESKEKVGTTFTITLPLAVGEPVRQENAPEALTS